MIPTITGLTGSTILSQGNVTLPSVDDTSVAVRGSNDQTYRAFESTMDRILSNHNFDRARRKSVNDNVSPYRKTMDDIIERHNNNAYSRKYINSLKNANNNDTIPWSDGVVQSPPTFNKAYESTMNRMMSFHNAHDREFTSPANSGGDNPIATSYMSRMRAKHMFYPGDDDLPEYANDSSWKKKRVIDTSYNDGKKKTSEKRKRKSQDESIVGILRSIDSNTSNTDDNVEKILKALKHTSVDSLRDRERDLEGKGNPNPDNPNGNPDMAPEGKFNGSGNPFGDIFKAGKGLIGTAAIGGAGILGEIVAKANGAVEEVKKIAGGGFNSSGQTPSQRAEGRQGGAYPRSVPRITSGDLTEREAAFIEMIMKREGADANRTFGMNSKGQSRFITPEQMYNGRHLTDLNINEIRQYQSALRQQTRQAGYGRTSSGAVVGTSAVGMGQFVEGTMVSTLKDLGINEDQFNNTKLTEELQAKMILQILAKKRGLDIRNIENWSDADKRSLGAEWESLSINRGKISAGDLDKELKDIASKSNNKLPKTPPKPKQAPGLKPQQNLASDPGVVPLGALPKSYQDRAQEGAYMHELRQFSNILVSTGKVLKDTSAYLGQKYNEFYSGKMFEKPAPKPAQNTQHRGQNLNQASNDWNKKDNKQHFVVINNSGNTTNAPRVNTKPAAKPARKPASSKSWWDTFADYF